MTSLKHHLKFYTILFYTMTDLSFVPSVQMLGSFKTHQSYLTEKYTKGTMSLG